MWGWGRPRRNLPEVNYAESESEDDINLPDNAFENHSPLQSPTRPVHTREGSPVELAHPTLADNVDEVLEEVNWALVDIKQNEEDVEELTDLLEDIETDKSGTKAVGEAVEESGLIVQKPQSEDCQAPPPALDDEDVIMASNFEDENENDTAGAFEQACRNLKGYEWAPDDLKFYFNQIEIKMRAVGLKKQFSKLQVLSTILPKQVTDEVKPILSKQETEFTENNSYKLLKEEILRIFGPEDNHAFETAMSRVLTSTPSQLARALVNDMCSHGLRGCCCHKWIYGQWMRNLPSGVRAGIAGSPFNADTFIAVTTLADKIFAQNRVGGQSARLAAVTVTPPTNPTPPYIQEETPTQQDPDLAAITAQVAAIYYQRGGRVQRAGRGRGGRANRGTGRGQSNGGFNFNAGNFSQNQGNSGGRGGRGQPRPPYSAANPRHRGTRHPDMPPFESCKKHFIWGKSAHMCLEPLTCPWASFLAPRPSQ